MTTTVTLEVDVPVDKLPDIADVKWVSATFDLCQRSVLDAIQEGYLPATKIGNSYAINPIDAVRLWGPRLHRRAVKSNTNN